MSKSNADSKGAVSTQAGGPPAAPEAGAEHGVQRENWGGQLEFILTCVGYAVGLGNVWRFPYLTYQNGGGAFLIPYFLVLIFVGLPLFFLELSFGQFASVGPLAIWTASPFFKGLGYTMVVTNTFIGIYYNVIISWSIYFFFASMTSQLPWEKCGNDWNDDYCATTDQFRNYTDYNITEIVLPDNTTIGIGDLQTPSEQYFYNAVLKVSGGLEDFGGIVWQLALTLLLAWTIVFLVLIKGISSLGKVVYFSSLFPYVLLTVMMVRGVTLSGAREGVLYYLRPDFNRLTDARVWSDAATQIFFSLSACTGGLIAMASYNKFDNNCLRDSVLVPIINCLTSFYSGFAIFSVLGFMAEEKGVTVQDVAASGPGLVFVVYPEALTQMPIAPLWAILFFFMLITLGFSSQFSIMECFFSSFIDEYPDALRKSRTRTIIFRAVFCIIFYLIGLTMVTNGGFYLFNVFDDYISGFPLLFVGLFETCVLCIVYGYNNFSLDIKMMLGKRPNIYFQVCWRLLSPLILLAVIVFLAIQYETPEFLDIPLPSWGEGIGFLIVAICLVPLPLMMIIKPYQNRNKAETTLEVIKMTLRPVEGEWGPASPLNRAKDPRYSSGVDVDLHDDKTANQVHSNGYENRGYVPSSSDDIPKPFTFGSEGSANPVDDLYSVPQKRFMNIYEESTSL